MIETIFTQDKFEKIIYLCRTYPNDMELGNKVRKEFSEIKFPLPLGNDGELGKETRKFFHKILAEKK